MSDAPPDLKALARRYLDLWQDQVTAMATDPGVAEAVARGITMMSQGAAAFAQPGQPAPGGAAASPDDKLEPDAPAGNSAHNAGQDLADGAAALAAALGDARLDTVGLARRVAVLEERVAVLEAALGAAGGAAGGGGAGKPRKRRS